MPEPFIVPVYQTPEWDTPLPRPDEPASFIPHHLEGESSSATRPLLDREVLVNGLVSSGNVQSTTGQDAAALSSGLASKWTVETALQNGEFDCRAGALERLWLYPPCRLMLPAGRN